MDNEIQKLIASRRWYHSFEIAPGIWSPGRARINAGWVLTASGIPQGLEAKRVIDIGAADGAYTFEFLRRGASVLAIDVQPPDNTGFGIANQLAPRPAEHRTMSVYDLSPAVGTFDIVWFWGVYYHLREPLLALRAIRSVLKKDGLLYFGGEIIDGADPNKDPRLAGMRDHFEALRDVPVTYFTHGNAYAGDHSNWFVPNMACLREWLIASGFKDIQMETGSAKARVRGTARYDETWQDQEHPLRRRSLEIDTPEEKSAPL
ncbi:MAG TPA: DUF1698 domain-containing protein [Stellaceae bacterium]|nr:DUF1698 domain-containing protein [Stellaceae bacterium]